VKIIGFKNVSLQLIEAVVLPMTHKERFENLGIQPPKGVLLYGPPGTGMFQFSLCLIFLLYSLLVPIWIICNSVYV
jgi:AAA+ superfamily predicted ATPase